MGRIVLLLMAAGQSRRMGEPKLHLQTQGRTVAERSLEIFRGKVDGLYVVSDDVFLRRRLVCDGFAAGGAERSDSVQSGLALLHDEDYVLIHDAARPFLSEAALERCLEMAREGVPFTLAIPVKDTIKRVCGQWVEESLDRSTLFAAQTPQGSPVGLLRAAYKKNRAKAFTDDAGVLEAAGCQVRIVPGEEGNIKLTTGEDRRYL